MYTICILSRKIPPRLCLWKRTSSTNPHRVSTAPSVIKETGNFIRGNFSSRYVNSIVWFIRHARRFSIFSHPTVFPYLLSRDLFLAPLGNPLFLMEKTSPRWTWTFFLFFFSFSSSSHFHLSIQRNAFAKCFVCNILVDVASASDPGPRGSRPYWIYTISGNNYDSREHCDWQTEGINGDKSLW